MLLGKLRNFPEDRKGLVRDLQGRRDDEKEVADGFAVDSLVLYTLGPPAKGKAEPADHQRAAVRYGNSPPDARGAEILPPLDDSEEGSGGPLIHAQQAYQLRQDLVL